MARPTTWGSVLLRQSPLRAPESWPAEANRQRLVDGLDSIEAREQVTHLPFFCAGLEGHFTTLPVFTEGSQRLDLLCPDFVDGRWEVYIDRILKWCQTGTPWESPIRCEQNLSW
jgi:hypothetical protein